MYGVRSTYVQYFDHCTKSKQCFSSKKRLVGTGIFGGHSRYQVPLAETASRPRSNGGMHFFFCLNIPLVARGQCDGSFISISSDQFLSFNHSIIILHKIHSEVGESTVYKIIDSEFRLIYPDMITHQWIHHEIKFPFHCAWITEHLMYYVRSTCT